MHLSKTCWELVNLVADHLYLVLAFSTVREDWVQSECLLPAPEKDTKSVALTDPALVFIVLRIGDGIIRRLVPLTAADLMLLMAQLSL